MIWQIAAILVLLPSVISSLQLKINLNTENPEAKFETPNYPKPHNAVENCRWVISAPGNTRRIKVQCTIDINPVNEIPKVTFTYMCLDQVVAITKNGELYENLKGSTVIFEFKSSMTTTPVHRGVTCKVYYDPTDIRITTTPVNPSCSCGEEGVVRIIGGKETRPNKYPWQAVLIQKEDISVFCGGSLIARQWVLSAIHCVNRKTPSSISVVLGEHNIDVCDLLTRGRNVKDIIMHTGFGKKAEGENDIALLFLENAVAYNEVISPICLPFNYKNNDFTDQIGISAGWGRTDINDPNSKSKVLREINQTIIMPSKCTILDDHVWHPDQITENMICALGENEITYLGDSGGPMVWRSAESGLSFQLGITSAGPQNSAPNKPEVYVRVSQLVDWIVGKTKAMNEFCVKI